MMEIDVRSNHGVNLWADVRVTIDNTTVDLGLHGSSESQTLAQVLVSAANDLINIHKDKIPDGDHINDMLYELMDLLDKN